MKTNFLKKLMVLFLALTLMVPMVSGIEAKAATEPTLSKQKMTIGIGSYGEKKEYRYHKSANVIAVKNANKAATYSFTSKDKKIVTVTTKGTKGYLTGVSAGTTKIVVKQDLNGKKTTVGTCEVTVKKSSLGDKVNGNEAYLMLWNQDVYYEEFNFGKYSQCYIKYYNPAAKYTYETNSKNLKIKHVKVTSKHELFGYDMEGGYVSYTQAYKAKKEGTYTVTVKETYNGKTRVVGKYKVIVDKNISAGEA